MNVVEKWHISEDGSADYHAFELEDGTIVEDYSDGVPLPVGDGGMSEREMPDPPRGSTALNELDNTVKIKRSKS